MRIKIEHQTHYNYSAPVKGAIQILRLTPRNHNNQYVVRWNIDVSQDCVLNEHEDSFGNICHTFTTDQPFDHLTVSVVGEIEIENTNGVLSGTIENFPPSLFLRETDLTNPDSAIKTFAAKIMEANEKSLDRLHALLHQLHNEIIFDTSPTQSTTTAAEAFALKRGVCQDLSHIFISVTRIMNIPARYVSGYFHRIDGIIHQDAGHAWAEAYVPDIGWIGFDPTNGICTTDAHVRIAIGLDYLGASPVRGTRIGGGEENLEVKVLVDQANKQSQN
jgi:transglutaminase-like putative cysteine protease